MGLIQFMFLIQYLETSRALLSSFGLCHKLKCRIAMLYVGSGLMIVPYAQMLMFLSDSMSVGLHRLRDEHSKLQGLKNNLVGT